jgi:hypothetical protein
MSMAYEASFWCGLPPKPQAVFKQTHLWAILLSPEAEFLDVIGTKALTVFPPCYSQSPPLTDFTPTPLLEQEWFETGL